MNKFFNKRAVLALGIIVTVILVAFFLMRSCDGDRTISASLSTTEVMLGERIYFADSTYRAERWVWEFGNGDYSEEQSGYYVFPDEGRYQVRLRVDNKLEKQFIVRVKPYAHEELDQIIRINAPETAIQGEYILFMGEGNDKEWRWEFGESGIVDSREKNPIYSYSKHGTYQILLSTENTQYPVMHMIEILPKYIEGDSTSALSLAALDIKEKLQNIADGKPFNANYNAILNKYLCGKANIMVTVNNNKRNDFYSYCQGLRLIGKDNTVIETVYAESKNPGSNCIDNLIVLQHDKNPDYNQPASEQTGNE